MRNALILLGLAGVFLGWNAPNHYPPWTAFHLELCSAVGLIFVVAATFAFAAPKSSFAKRAGEAVPRFARLPAGISVRIWLAVATWPLAQYAVGQLHYRGDALLGALYGVGVALAIYGGSLWAAQQSRADVLRVLFTTLLAAALVACGLALAQWLHITVPSWAAMELIDDRPYGNFAQPNHFGLAMVMGIVALTALFETGSIRRRWIYYLALAFFEWGVLMSESRAAALALGAVAVLWLLTRRRAPTRLQLSDLLIGAVIAAVLFAAAEPLQRLLLLQESAARPAVEADPRTWIWLHFWAAIRQHPWFGYGFDQAVMALAEVAGQVHPSRNVVYAHNVVLDLMTWFGIPCAILLVVLLAGWLLGWLRKADNPSLSAQRHWVFAIWLALAVQSMFEFPFAHAYFLIPAGLLAGAIAPIPIRVIDSNAAPTLVRASRAMQAVALVAAALLCLMTWEYFRSESDFRFNRFARANFSTKVSHESLEAPWVLDQLGELNASARIRPRPGMPEAEIAQLHRLSRRFHIPSVHLEYARALALNGRMRDAEYEMQVIRSVNPAVKYRSIEREWLAWLQAHQLKPSSAATSRSISTPTSTQGDPK